MDRHTRDSHTLTRRPHLVSRRRGATFALGLAISMSLACFPPPDTGGDGGGAGGGSGGNGGSADGGAGPVFTFGPEITARTTDTLTVAFGTDRAVTGGIQWRGPDSVGSVDLPTASTQHEATLTGLAPGRTIDLGVAVQDSNGLTASQRLRARTNLLDLGTVRVLFDAAHDQDAGNADWIIDDSGRVPTPDTPGDELDWNGAYSAWGFELYKAGRFQVRSLPPGNLLDSGELSAVDVVVIPEPNSSFSGTELAALETFVRGGGGLVIIANHGGSDRNNNGWDAVSALRDLLSRGFGVSLVGDKIDGPARMVEGHPLGDGPFGPVALVGGFDSTSILVDTATNPGAEATAKIDRGGVLTASGTLGAGRFVVHGDSAAADDGTDSGGNTNIFDAWTEQDNAAFFLNAVSWVAGEY